MVEPSIGKVILEQFKRFQESQVRIELELMEIKNCLNLLASREEYEAMRFFLEKRLSIKEIEEKLLPLRDLAVLAPGDFADLLESAAMKLKQVRKN